MNQIKKVLTLKFIVISCLTCNVQNTRALGFVNSLKKAATSKKVWIPSASALVLSLSNYDGKITKWASDNKPIFGSVKNASNYSDLITFYYFPGINLISQGRAHYQSKEEINYINHYFSFLMAPALTYLINKVLKDQTGRIRPDASNDLSFPSAHTSIASSLSEEFYHHSQGRFSKSWHNRIHYFNETLVGSVAWARMEAKRHHFSDVLVGYSLGKFVSQFIHSYLFDDNNQISFSAKFNQREDISGTFAWSF